MNYFIFVDGAYGCGKTTFIETLCGEVGRLPLLEEDVAAIEPPNPHFPLEIYGGLYADFQIDKVYLIDMPGARRIDGIWKILANCPVFGFLTFVNSGKPETFREGKSKLETSRAYAPVPAILVANYQDHPNAIPAEALKALYNTDQTVLPCIATDPESVKTVLIRLLELYLRETYTAPPTP